METLRRTLSGLVALAVAGSLLGAASPATAVQDDLGMPVFTGADPVPAEPVRYEPRKMMEEIYKKEKGGDSYWIDRMLARPGDDPAGTWLMSRGRALFMKEHDPSVIGFGGSVAYWESIDNRGAYTVVARHGPQGGREQAVADAQPLDRPVRGRRAGRDRQEVHHA